MKTYYCIADSAIGVSVEYVVQARSFHDARLQFEDVKCGADQLIQIETRQDGWVERFYQLTKETA
jgi:hypothetical protein